MPAQEKKDDDDDDGTMPPYDQETQTLIDGKCVCMKPNDSASPWYG